MVSEGMSTSWAVLGAVHHASRHRSSTTARMLCVVVAYNGHSPPQLLHAMSGG